MNLTARWTVLIISAVFSFATAAQQATPGKTPNTPRKKAKTVVEKESGGALKVEKPSAEADSPLLTNSSVGSSGPMLKFNTDDAPTNTDPRAPIKFKGMDSYSMPTTPETPQPILEATANDDDTFKSYIGYPKHELQLTNGYDNVAAKWGYNGKDFNFRNSTMALGLNYTFVAAPMWKIGAYYSQYSIAAPAGTSSPYVIADSTATVAKYGFNGEYCYISSANFYRQYCVGGTVMNDSYPVLKFTSATRLVASKVDDIVVGVHGAIQIPFNDRVYFRPVAGFNYGTGAGQSGALTSTYNTSLFLRLELPVVAARWLTLKGHADYSSRQATIEGTIGTNKDKWETDSTILGGGVDAIFVF